MTGTSPDDEITFSAGQPMLSRRDVMACTAAALAAAAALTQSPSSNIVRAIVGSQTVAEPVCWLKANLK
jgi:hypothetical protein